MAAVLAGCGGTSKPARVTSSPSPPSTTTSAPPTASYPQTTGHTSTAGATGVVLPATFRIESGGKLSPASVTAPAGVTIDLTLISADGKAHQVRAPAPRPVSVPTGGRASVVLKGLKRGRYALVVDGAPRGTLIVGGHVGP